MEAAISRDEFYVLRVSVSDSRTSAYTEVRNQEDCYVSVEITDSLRIKQNWAA